MMHAVGFFHEDSRPDRDEHVDTDREKMRVNTVSMVGEYDVCSIMHHNSHKLVPKKCKVWTCADCPDCYNCDVGDVRRNVTELDVQKINCEAQGKGRAKGRPRNVTKRSFIDMDGGWWWLSFP